MSVNIIQRAYELAASGRFKTMSEVRLALKREGYEAVDRVFAGGGLRAEINTRIKLARGAEGV